MFDCCCRTAVTALEMVAMEEMLTSLEKRAAFILRKEWRGVAVTVMLIWKVRMKNINYTPPPKNRAIDLVGPQANFSHAGHVVLLKCHT